MEKKMIVCVTGGSGFLASSLIKELLQRGYTVHATLRNLGDQSKVGILKALPHADKRLKLFQADVYNGDEFAAAIEGCQVVIHMATPLQHNPESSQYKNTSEAAVAGVRSIMASCLKSNTVKKLIYTASVVAASPLKEDGSGYKDTMDDTCWTPLGISVPYENDFLADYKYSKTFAEKEVLSYQGGNVEVVTLACGLVGGDTSMASIGTSTSVIVSQLKSNEMLYNTLRFLEELLGKVPIVHVEDVTAAHIFCMEDSVPSGRYLCANEYLKTAEIAAYYQQFHPGIKISDEFVEDSKRETTWGSTKLENLGFRYKHDAKTILNDSVECARRLGFLA